MGVFETLNSINVNEHTEKVKSEYGKDLTYLSWNWAWAEVMKRYPDATYEIEKFNNLPYVYDELTGYMVYTKVTIDGMTREMWLPVMDSKNKAMKAFPYEYTTRNGTKTVEAATMFDVNKAIMRCLVKNLAMFGLGLYIYAGEDLPEAEAEVAKKMAEKITDKDVKVFKAFLDSVGANEENILKAYNHKSLEEFTQGEYTAVKNKINEQRLAKEKEEKAKK